MEPFKNMINDKVAKQISEAIIRNYPEFDKKRFLRNIDKELSSLELKDRVIFIAEKLNKFLPEGPRKSLPILRGAIQQNENDHGGVIGFATWPLTEYIARFGLLDFDLSMDTLKEMTKVFTAEFAVRNFFIHDEKRALRHFEIWVNDNNFHVRRLVSEGSRPLLPWGKKLSSFELDPKITWGFLEILKNDESEYVRKSVANHLNDHSKKHPDLVVKKLLEWKKSRDFNKNLDWVIRHASRTLIKKGHPKAFLFHGVEAGEVEVLSQQIITKRIDLGDVLRVEVEFKNKSSKKLKIILDHEVHLLRANNKYNIKCFKGKNLELKPSEKTKLAFNIPIKKVTTRAYYGGKHFWNIKVNGISEKRMPFILNV